MGRAGRETYDRGGYDGTQKGCQEGEELGLHVGFGLVLSMAKDLMPEYL